MLRPEDAAVRARDVGLVEQVGGHRRVRDEAGLGQLGDRGQLPRAAVRNEVDGLDREVVVAAVDVDLVPLVLTNPRREVIGAKLEPDLLAFAPLVLALVRLFVRLVVHRARLVDMELPDLHAELHVAALHVREAIGLDVVHRVDRLARCVRAERVLRRRRHLRDAGDLVRLLNEHLEERDRLLGDGVRSDEGRDGAVVLDHHRMPRAQVVFVHRVARREHLEHGAEVERLLNVAADVVDLRLNAGEVEHEAATAHATPASWR